MAVENESVQTDEITMQQAYDRKQARKLKLSSIFAMAVCLIVAVAVVVMACVKQDVRPSFVKEASPSEVTIVAGSYDVSFDSDDTANYSAFMNYYQQAFSLSSLQSLFSGQWSNDYSISETSTTFSTSNLSTLVGSDYVWLHYDTAVTVINSNGTTYASIRNASTPGSALTFKDAYFTITSESGISSVKFVFAVSGTSDDTIKVTTITINADTSLIYNNVEAIRDAV